MAIINGIQLLHKRYADWSGKTLQAGELGLNLTTLEVRIGTAANQSWENASVVSCKVEIQGTGKHIVGASYENGKLILTQGTLSYEDLNDKPELNYEEAGAVAAHNSAADAHSDIRTAVQGNADAIAQEVTDRQGEITRVEGLVTTEVNRAKAAEEGLQTAVNGKVAQTAYNEKVAALEQADQTELTNRQSEITRVEGLINTEKGRIDTLEQTTIPGINAKVKANEDAIKALEGLTSSGLSRQIVTELPSVDSALENVIYMILRTDPEDVTVKDGDIYDEYLLMGEGENKRFELLGNTAVDFSDYYTKGQVYKKDETYSQTEVDNKVDGAVSKEVTDRETAVQGVQNQLDVLKGANTVEGSVAKAVKDAVDAEATTRKADDDALSARIKTIEDKNLADGNTYATKVELEAEADRAKKAEQDNATLIQTNANDIDSLEGRMGTAEGDIDDLEAAVAVINGEATQAGSIKEEAKLRAEADTVLGSRISDLEKITADGALEMVDKTIRHKESGVTASAEFGFYALKVDKYGHITGVEAISTLDGNDE